MAVVVTIAKGYDLSYIWKTQDRKAERAIGGYYLDAAQAGEPPGRWWGPGAQALGLTPGQNVHRQPYDAVYRQTGPRSGAQLGQPRGRYPTFADHLARLTAAEPYATAERLIELEREAAQATRQPAAYYDVTISFSKSISVLHASIRENERRARLGGDRQAAAYWAGREQAFQEVLHKANRAALEYLQAWAGITRTGYHGTRIDGREPGRFEPAGLIVTSWLQGTSRDGDPQDHIHNQIARITRTFRDGKWRALDTMSVRAVLGALQAVAATTVECELTREFGVAWIPRADGRGNEIRCISQAQLDAYSTRTVQVREKERELARTWERKHGRAPTSRELLHIANAATLQSRKGKEPGAIDWDALAQRWDATLGGELAGIALAVSDARGPGVRAGEHRAGRAPSGPPAPEAQTRALAKALVLVSEKHPAWTRHDLLKQLALVLPAETRHMSPEEAQELLLGLVEEALSGRSGEVVCLEAPEWLPLPASLRRQLDGRSVYSRPGVARYATAAQLSMEERLVAHAQTQAAPCVPGELAARRLGADLAQLRAALAGGAQDAREHAAWRGLRLRHAKVDTAGEILSTRLQHEGAGDARRPALRDQAELAGAGDGLGAVARAELGQDVADVLLDGVEGDHELARDGLVRPAGRQHLQYLKLTAGQRVDQALHRRDAAPPGARGDVLRAERPLEPGQAAERDRRGRPAGPLGRDQPGQQRGHRRSLVGEDPDMALRAGQGERRSQRVHRRGLLAAGGQAQRPQRADLDQAAGPVLGGRRGVQAVQQRQRRAGPGLGQQNPGQHQMPRLPGVVGLVLLVEAALRRPARGSVQVALSQEQPGPLRRDRVERARGAR